VKAGRYEIRIQGTLSPDWADWFEGMEMRQEAEGQTVLEGPVVDQAALHGLLARLRDLNLTLISVNPTPAETSPTTTTPMKEPAGSRDKGE
jgi:hypothetical protein